MQTADKPEAEPEIEWAPGEAEAIVRALEPGIRLAAAKLWARHPNNPANKGR